MASDDPPYLPVGTAVSAKYRGAFCEAKVKVIKKHVKCKIKFRSGPCVVISDEFVKGPLKIGNIVEAKQSETGPFESGTIMKLNDASIYTVVFDDGDERTLRRTLLCLQGEKHFHESETLDHLPLTDPENFGTPVMKQNKKRNRRSSNRSQSDEDEDEDEDEEEDSDEEESPKKQRKEEADDAVGKVVIVEFHEKRKNSLFPALVVDPSCTKDLVMRSKDQIIVRSFKDNKFYTVSKSSRKPFLTKDHTYKGDNGAVRAATEKAVTFIDTGQLPSNWDMEMLKKKTKQGHIDSVDDTSEDSSDDEYDMEKDAWLASLHKFMEERGTPINKPPVLGFRDLNLYKLYKLVHDYGGCRKVTDKQLWRHIMTKMGIPVSQSSNPYNIHTAYNRYLFAFEEFNRKMGPNPRVFTRTRRRSFDRGWITPQIIQRHRSSSGKQEAKDDSSDKNDEEGTPKRRPTRKREKDESPSPDIDVIKREARESKANVKVEKDEDEQSDKGDKKSSRKSLKDEKFKEKITREDKIKNRTKRDDDSTERSANEEKMRERLKEEKARDTDDKNSIKGGDDKGKDKGGKVKEETNEEKLTPGKGKSKEKKGKGREEGSRTPELKTEFDVGEKVLVHYGKGKTERIYEAKVVDIEMKGKEPIFTVHYTGWNNRYDEAIKRNRIVGSAEKKKATPKGKIDSDKTKEKKEKEEQERKHREEEQRKELKEMERQAKEIEERQAKARLEKERIEKERQEKDKKEKERQERERKERERQEKDRKEKERKEKEKRERMDRERKEQQEKEKREKIERERKEKEQREKQEKERVEKEKKEKQEKERKEKEKKEKHEKEKRDKEERERKEKEKEKAVQEKLERENKEKARDLEKKEKEKAAKESKRTPTGKRGRPSLSKSSPVPPSSPRSSSAASSRGNKSPSPASIFTQRSMRSDRKSLNESPFATGLYVRSASRTKRSSIGDKHSQDSDSEDEDDQSENQLSTQDSEDSRQTKDRKEQDENRASLSSKMQDVAATLIKASEQKPNFDDDVDDGPPTLTAQVSLASPESRLQESPSKVEAEKPEPKSVGRPKKDKRGRKSLESKERDSIRDLAAAAAKIEKQSRDSGAKEASVKEDVKVKMEDTPVLVRQVPMEAQLKEKLEELKQEDKDSTSDADKPTEKRRGRKKGRKSSIDNRKRGKTESEVDTPSKIDNSELHEPKKKHAKMDRRKSEKGRKKHEHDSRLNVDNMDGDLVSSSMEEKSLAGTSKSFITTPPTTPESSPKMPSSPSHEEDITLKVEEQSSNKSDSDALIEVAISIDDKDPNNANSTSGAAKLKSATTPANQDASPKKRRRGISESEPGKKRRKRSRRRKSSLSDRRHTSHHDRGNSSDTDESRSESRLVSSGGKHQFHMKSFPRSLAASLSDAPGDQKQRRWNFLVDLTDVKEPDKRISILQTQLKDLRSVYMRLKQEVATIDRRRKKFRKKEREAAQVMADVALAFAQGHSKQESSTS